ncbi:MAG TPA: hypothetical protein VGD75_01820 [Bradyrhizobium sp.]
MAAITTALDVTAESSGAATLDREHGAPSRRGQRPAMLITKSRAEAAEHIRHFQPLAGHEPALLQAGARSGKAGKPCASS